MFVIIRKSDGIFLFFLQGGNWISSLLIRTRHEMNMRVSLKGLYVEQVQLDWGGLNSLVYGAIRSALASVLRAEKEGQKSWFSVGGSSCLEAYEKY